MFVSHNRSLIRTLATRIWNVEGGRVETYPGTLDEYMYSKAQRRQSRAAPSPREVISRQGAEAPRRAEDDKARKRREAEAQAEERSAKLGPLEKQVAQLEERIGVLEAEQKVRIRRPQRSERLRRRGAPQQAARTTSRRRRTSSRS